MEDRGTSTYGLDQYNEVLVAVTRALPSALEGTDPKQVISTLQSRGEAFGHIIRGTLRSFLAAPVFARDMTKEGWELVEDVSEPAEISIGDFEPSSFLYQHENSISGEEMRNRAKGMEAMLGQRHAEYFLEHEGEISKDWRGHYLVFPGTVWRDRFGHLSVPCLYWVGGRWCLYFRWLGRGFGSRGRLLRLSK